MQDAVGEVRRNPLAVEGESRDAQTPLEGARRDLHLHAARFTSERLGKLRTAADAEVLAVDDDTQVASWGRPRARRRTTTSLSVS